MNCTERHRGNLHAGNSIVVRTSAAMESTHGNEFVTDITARIWDATAGEHDVARRS